MSVTEPKDRFLTQSDELDRLPAAKLWTTIRQQGRNRLRELSFPSARTEDWRFTSVAGLLKESFVPSTTANVAATALPPLCHSKALRLTFVNGAFAPELSRLEALPDGVLLGPLSNPGTSTEALARHLAQVADADDHVFTALNTALLSDGAFLILPANVVLDRPVEIVYLTKPGSLPIAAHPRTLVVLGQHAQATVVERFLGIGEPGRAFTNAVAEFALAEGAILDHVKLQQENTQTYHIANTQVTQARGSNFTTHAISLGGQLARNEIRVRFDGEGCEATVNGLYRGQGTQHLDNHTVIDHAMPHCNSHEVYKGVLGDKSHGVFNGKIFVRKDAQKTDAKQTNKVLLLSEDATINTKPQLEIFADDVKCTHGATVGQLDENQVYYLRSRGIGREDARRILTFAFANDIVGRIKLEAIREEIEAILVQEG